MDLVTEDSDPRRAEAEQLFNIYVGKKLCEGGNIDLFGLLRSMVVDLSPEKTRVKNLLCKISGQTRLTLEGTNCQMYLYPWLHELIIDEVVKSDLPLRGLSLIS